MITVRVRVYPALGREAEVRSFMTEWVKTAQGQGERLGLAQRVYSSEGSMLAIPRWFQDVAAADARRQENRADAAWQANLTKLNAMIREPVRQSLEEIIVPPGPSSTPPGVVRRVFFFPAMDKVGELRARLSEVAETASAAGRPGVSLSQGIFSDIGPLLVLTTTHADLAELDQVRRERAADAQALMATAAALSRAAAVVRLLEVIVPPQN
jgi:hypothetical protein